MNQCIPTIIKIHQQSAGMTIKINDILQKNYYFNLYVAIPSVCYLDRFNMNSSSDVA